MKVILLQDVRGIGNKNDMKDVANGYARNFLFQNNLAKPATSGNVEELERTKAKLDQEEAVLKKHLEGLARKMNGLSLEFELKTDKAG